MGVGTYTSTPGTYVDSDLAAGANVDPSKLRHHTPIATDFGLKVGDTVTGTIERQVFVARGNASLRDFAAVLKTDGTSTDLDFDLLVNGVSVLSAAVNITDSTGDGTPVSGTISSATLTAGDIVSLKMTYTSATGADGPLAQVIIDHYYV